MSGTTSKKDSPIDEDEGDFGPMFRNCSPADGSLNVDLDLRNALTQAISNCGKKRSQICAELTDLTGVDVTKSSLDTWTAESKSKSSTNEDFNNNKRWGIPTELIVAFCVVTGDDTPLRMLAEKMGLRLMDREQQITFQLLRLEKEKKRIARKIKAGEKLLKGMVR